MQELCKYILLKRHTTSMDGKTAYCKDANSFQSSFYIECNDNQNSKRILFLTGYGRGGSNQGGDVIKRF